MKKMNFESVGLKNIEIKDGFWMEYIRLVHEVVIPYQWEALNDRVQDAEPSHAIKNFRIAAGLEKGEFQGLVFQDSDFAKWLEALAYRLDAHRDPEWERLADEVIDIIEKAQQADGYLNTYFTIKEPGKRWTNLQECHELYIAGHLIEAAVAYYHATGKRKLLDIMCRFADHIASVFGTEKGKLAGYDGHQEIELALIKLYSATGNENYLNLSKYFIDERGKEPCFFSDEWEKRGKTSYWGGMFSGDPKNNLAYFQAHLPVRKQRVAVGHAVRLVYMLTGMAELGGLTGDAELLEACRALWDNIVYRQMYITGGIGSTNHGESVTFDYDLPNDTIYQETCASVGLVFFAHRMLQLEARSGYADVLERALYNCVLSGMSLDGKRFFYVNPLEVWPEACEKNPSKNHVKPVRQRWYGCACCPPNIARLIASLGQYIYTKNEDTVYTHLYICSSTKIELQGMEVILTQKTEYPWTGKVVIEVQPKLEKKFTLALRIPGWCGKSSLTVNGSEPLKDVVEGYVLLKRVWKEGDKVELEFDMPVVMMEAHPGVRANAGRVAIQRGPLVYCIEEIDNGSNLSAVSIPGDAEFTAEYKEDVLGGVVVIKGKGYRRDEPDWDSSLYRKSRDNEKDVDITAVPYSRWGNRNPGEMMVWIRKR